VTTTSDDARRRVSAFAWAVAAVSVVGFLLAWAFDWPSTFVLDDAADGQVGPEDVVNGTVTSVPLVPLLVLVLAGWVARRRDRLGTAGVVVLLLLGLLFAFGGANEITSENDAVARPVLVVAGLVFVALGLALAALAVDALRRRDAPAG